MGSATSGCTEPRTFWFQWVFTLLGVAKCFGSADPQALLVTVSPGSKAKLDKIFQHHLVQIVAEAFHWIAPSKLKTPTGFTVPVVYFIDGGEFSNGSSATVVSISSLVAGRGNAFDKSFLICTLPEQLLVKASPALPYIPGFLL
jgi:hypothetical protein